MLKVAVLIDGGHLRVQARRGGHKYIPDFIEKVAHACVHEQETLLRVLYYDCPPFNGEVKLPVSGKMTAFSGSDKWLNDLAAKDLFAIRKGVLKFRGFKPKKIPVAAAELKDEDFSPDFEQKGVDMRIGLDMANFAADRTVDRIILVTGDTDCVPAMKNCRIRGLQVILASMPDHRVAPELLWHADFERAVGWP
ncbi:NYN domain-containing protein [Bradyrhizobium diazoefficiens]|nr:NYN domain-containing protein [Bradyrhizobium diazoefficiens]